jgi:hypothetical protein
VCRPFYKAFQSNRNIHVGSTDRNSFTPLAQVWLSLGRFLRNSQFFDKLLQMNSVANSMKIRKTISGRSKTDGRDIHIRCSFLLHKERLIRNYIICIIFIERYYFYKYYSDMSKKHVMSGECNIQRETRNAYKIFVGKLKRRNCFRELGIPRLIKLTCTFQRTGHECVA